MNKIFTEKRLTIINFVIVFYFAAVYALYYYNIEFVIIGILREMMTIPFLFAQILFLFLGIRLLVMEKKRWFLFVFSILILAVCTVLTIGSFF